MISKVIGQSEYISVFHSHPSVYLNAQSGAGMLRSNHDRIEVFDGYSWQSCSGEVSISLTTKTVELLKWVEDYKEEKEKETQLLKQYPGLQHAKEKYELLLTLAKSETNNNT